MATYEYNDKIKFVLPAGFILEREENDDGEEVVNILAGEYENAEGETCYAFRCQITDSEYDPDDMDDDITSENLFDVVTDRFVDEGAKKIKVTDDPETYFISKPIPLQIFGHVMKMYGAVTVIRFSDWTGVNLISSNTYKDDEPEENAKVCENVYEVLKSIRLDGKKIPLDNISPEIIQKVIEASFDCDNETIDVSPTIRFNIKSGDEVRSLEYTSEGMKEVEYDGDGLDLNLDGENVTIDCDINPEKITDLHDELREALIDKMEDSGDYLYPETEDFFISGVFTDDPDFDVLEEICDHTCDEADSNYDGDWSASRLLNFLKDEIGDKEAGDRYYISPSFGGLSPILALLPFLAAYSDIHSLDVTFTHDKWEARGDYSSSERVGIKLKSGEFVVGKFNTDDDFDSDSDDDDDDDYSSYNQRAADEWMAKYGKYVESNPYIDFNGKLFVFSGIAWHAAEKDAPIVQKVIAKGGQYRSKVSGLTNYLVVNPAEAGSSKIVAVMEQLQKGKKITVVLLEDLERALEGNGASAPTSVAKSTASTTTKAAIPQKSSATISSSADFEIDSDNVLQKYYGNAGSVTIPSGVTEIAEDAFFANKDITSVVIPEGVTEIGSDAFWLCDNLEKVVLPSTIIKIGKNAFNSTAIKTIVIPDGCEEIGADCFTSCKQLKDIYVPASVYDIDDDAFCTFNDDTVIHTVRGSVAESHAKDNDITVDYKSAPVTSNVKKAPPKATSTTTKSDLIVTNNNFAIDDNNVLHNYMGDMQDVVIPEGVIELADDAFVYNTKTMKTVVIPEGVKVIGERAFFMCEVLEKVTLPSTIEKINNGAFHQCPKLTSIVIHKGCKEIGENCFFNCTNLKDIYVPDSVHTIGNDAFCTFNDATVIHTVKGSTAEFYANKNFITVDYKSVSDTSNVKTTSTKQSTNSTSGRSATKSVSAVDFTIKSGNIVTDYTGSSKDVVIPDGIVEIAEDAFLGKDIKSIVIPEGVKTIGANAFMSCKDLTKVVLPNSLTKICNNAFDCCTFLESFVIPDGCKEIGADCFTNCSALKDIYVPASVTKIGDDAFCTFYEAMVIHTVKGSKAESFAKENSYKIDYKAAPGTATQKATATAKAPAKTTTATNDDLSAQISEDEENKLTPEQVEALGEAQKILSDIGQSLADSEGAMEKYSDYLEQKEKREKEEAERKARAKAEAQAAGKSEKDVVNMYIILTNEKKLGRLHRSAEDFYDTYEEDFNAFSKDEVLQLRKDIMAEMEDDALCSYYAESFKQRTVEERFTVSTLNLSNVSDEPHLGIKAKWAIDNSTEWYADSERAEVKRLMDADLARIRADLDGQFDGVEPGWKKFTTAKSFLKIVINKKTAENGTIEPPYTFCKMIVGDNVVSVKLATSGLVSLTTIVMDCQPWYWGVTVRDIWEAAMANPVDDGREGATDGTQVANQVLNLIRTKYPTISSEQAKHLHESEEKSRLEADAKRKSEEARKAEEARLAEEKRAKKEKRAKTLKKAGIISAIAIALIIAFLIVLVTVIIPSIQYKKAEQLFAEGKYDQAEELYESIEGKEDSKTKLAVTKAISKIEEENYGEAIEELLENGVKVMVSYDVESDATLMATDTPINGIMLLSASNSSTNSFTYTTKESFDGLKAPQRNGYAFAKWELVSYKYNEDNSFSLSLSSKWNIETYKIELNLNGGTANNLQTYTIEDSTFTLVNPIKTGYTFLGWSNNESADLMLDVTIEGGTFGDLSYVANWKANDYVINLDADGGTLTEISIPVTYDSMYSLPTPTLKGHTFQGWYNGSTKVEDGTYANAQDLNLKAVWTANQYNVTYADIAMSLDKVNVTFDLNYSGSANKTTVTLSKNEILQYPTAPTREGYIFGGWFLDSECVQRYEFKGAISADMVLYASWTRMDEGSKVIDPSQYNSASNTLVISTAGTGGVYDSVYLGGGNRVYFVAPETGTYKMYYRNEKEGQNYTSAGELFNVTQNTRVDYIALTETTFYYESSYGYRYDYCLEFTCNKGDVMRLSVSVGTWYSVNTYFYFVGFTSNFNTSTAYADVDDYSKPTFTSQGTIEEKVTFGESFELLIPVREGYTFDGWYYNGQKVENGEWNIDEDAALTAKWVAN